MHELQGNTAVSYTHLDVYKRQVKFGLMSSLAICSCRKSCVVQPILVSSVIALTGNLQWWLLHVRLRFVLPFCGLPSTDVEIRPLHYHTFAPSLSCTLQLYSCKRSSQLANWPSGFLNLKIHASAACSVRSENSLKSFRSIGSLIIVAKLRQHRKRVIRCYKQL